MSIDAQEVVNYPTIFKSELEAAVAEYNQAIGVQLFEAPTYSGAAADIVVDVVPGSQRRSFGWTGQTTTGEWDGNWVHEEVEPGCLGMYADSATLRVADERYYWCSLCFPFIQQTPWAATTLKDLYLHELSHGTMRRWHVDKDGEHTKYLCPSNSVNCSGENRDFMSELTAEDLLALGCIYQDITP
jgi:hypothetical protein